MIKQLENESCKDQLFILMYEPQTADILYSVLIEKSISMVAKQKVLKVLLFFDIQIIQISIFINFCSCYQYYLEQSMCMKDRS